MKKLMLVLFLVVSGCSGPQQPADNEPGLTPEKPITAAALDPERLKYDNTYKALACRANQDYDPMDDLAIIHEPVDQLRKMHNTDDTRLKYYRQICEENGYATVQDFLTKDEFYKTAAPVWWERFRANLLQTIEGCKGK